MKKLLLTAAVVAITSPAFAAEYYVVQNPNTKRCTIVEQRPSSPGLGVVLGDRFFGIRSEAENYIKTTKVCEEGTVGGPSGGVRIEERERR
jgi:hypothetical protein